MTESYERRLTSIKESLERSSESNRLLLKDLNKLQMKYLRDTQASSEGQLHDLVKDKAELMIKVEK